jgi:hypothetical protein
MEPYIHMEDLQSEIINFLVRSRGMAARTELNRHCIAVWSKAYQGLLRDGWIAEGTENDKRVILLRLPEATEHPG